MAAERWQPKTGERVRDFELKKAAGQGRFGVVFKATDKNDFGTSLQRPSAVALKFLAPEQLAGRHPNPTAEVALARRVQSAFCLPVLDAFVHNGWGVIVLPWATDSLSEWLNRDPPIENRIQAAFDILRGLKDLHRAGVFHLDIKQNNVLRYGAHWALADFGISTSLASRTIHLANPAHYPPELPDDRAPANSKEAASIDVWACANLVYFVLTGHYAFEGASYTERRRRAQAGESVCLDDVPISLRKILKRCFGPAEQRPVSGIELADAVEDALTLHVSDWQATARIIAAQLAQFLPDRPLDILPYEVAIAGPDLFIPADYALYFRKHLARHLKTRLPSRWHVPRTSVQRVGNSQLLSWTEALPEFHLFVGGYRPIEITSWKGGERPGPTSLGRSQLRAAMGRTDATIPRDGAIRFEFTSSSRIRVSAGTYHTLLDAWVNTETEIPVGSSRIRVLVVRNLTGGRIRVPVGRNQKG